MSSPAYLQAAGAPTMRLLIVSAKPPKAILNILAERSIDLSQFRARFKPLWEEKNRTARSLCVRKRSLRISVKVRVWGYACTGPGDLPASESAELELMAETRYGLLLLRWTCRTLNLYANSSNVLNVATRDTASNALSPILSLSTEELVIHSKLHGEALQC
ncbi:hypothetical protein GSI_02509 [Ganoderma sinense ZZ0214-1]|uniref:Uncharacterized protein n=1 Tax=Ganoderma sinense ZZ0214-1 TaxID=1077348 RepID=A0A2G8SPS8_9APHY|nr:hypothetical protein GSI_02509 [Ganoderma sinense ZZ0214-1]